MYSSSYLIIIKDTNNNQNSANNDTIHENDVHTVFSVLCLETDSDSDSEHDTLQRGSFILCKKLKTHNKVLKTRERLSVPGQSSRQATNS